MFSGFFGFVSNVAQLWPQYWHMHLKICHSWIDTYIAYFVNDINFISNLRKFKSDKAGIKSGEFIYYAIQRGLSSKQFIDHFVFWRLKNNLKSCYIIGLVNSALTVGNSGTNINMAVIMATKTDCCARTYRCIAWINKLRPSFDMPWYSSIAAH